MLAVFFNKFSPVVSVGACVAEEVSQRVNLVQQIGEYLVRKSEYNSRWKEFEGFNNLKLLRFTPGRLMLDESEGTTNEAIP